MGSHELRKEGKKARILEAIEPLDARNAVRGQYRGYRGEPDVAANSGVETFAAVRLHIHTERWKGVRFFIRRIACPWGSNTMGIHQNSAIVTCAVDYEGRFTVGNIRDLTVCEAWRLLGYGVRRPHREHRWADVLDVCSGCDWQVAGAEYEAEQVEGTRPFW